MTEPRKTVEQALIGAMLIDSRAIDVLTAAGGSAVWFSDPMTRRAAVSIIKRYAAGQTASDTLAISEATGLELRWLDECTDSVPTAAHTGTYAAMLKYYADVDNLTAMNRTIQAAIGQATVETINETRATIEAAVHQHLSTRRVEARTMREAALAWLDRMSAPDSGSTLLDWPLRAITDEVGRIDRQYIWIVAQPSIGKTAFVLQLMAVLAERGHMTSLASLESPDESIAARLVSYIGRLNTRNIAQRRATLEEIEAAREAAERISDRIRVVDAGMSIDQIYAWGRAEARAGSKLLIIDNTRHIRTSEQDRVTAMATMSARCKQLRDDTRLPVIVLHHSKVNQDGKEGVSWSSDPEKDADLLIFLREIVNNTVRPCEDNPEGRWCVAFDVDKNRDGRKSTRTLMEFLKTEQRFTDWLEAKQAEKASAVDNFPREWVD